MNSIDLIKFIIPLFVFGGILFRKAIQIHKRFRHIQDTPRAKVSSAAQGLVELQGFAWPSSGCAKTISGLEVIYYDFQLERKETTGSGRGKKKEWVQVFQKEFKPEIYLVDPTGLALIDPQNADFEMLEKEIKNWNFLSLNTKEYVLNKLVRGQVAGFPPTSFLNGLFSAQYRIKEFYIRQGSPLFATGYFQTLPQSQTFLKLKGLTRFGQMVFDYEKRSEKKNISAILDQNKDGKVSHLESIEGFSFAASLALKRTRLDSLKEDEFPVFGQLSASEQHKLFLAPSKEENLLKNLKLKPVLYLTTGAAMITAGLFLTFGSKLEEMKNTVTMASSTSSLSMDIESLHRACVGGDSSACVSILENQKQFQFERAHLEYYTTKACSLGAQKFCR